MKVAVVGSRTLDVDDLGKYLPPETTEIVTGGAMGIDRSAAKYAKKAGLTLSEFFPDYARYKKGAPLKRNRQIAEYADKAVALWDGKSKGTLHTIRLFRALGKEVMVIRIEQTSLDL